MCKTYLVTLILVGLAALAYVGTDVCRQQPGYRKQLYFFVAITALISLLIYCLPISLYANADGSVVYSYGPSTWVTYMGALFFIIANIITLIAHKGRIYERQRRAVVACNSPLYNSAIIGLKANGTVVATSERNGKYNVSDWRDIVDVACGESIIIGLKADGTP